MAVRTSRRWRAVVGLVGPADVRMLQTKVHDYRASLQTSVDAGGTSGKGLPLDNSKHSIQAWGDLVARCVAFESESANDYNPLAYILAGSAYDRGRQLIDELDGFRDALVALKVPNVPDAVPVPHSDLGIAGGLGFALAAVVAIFLLRELK